MKRFSYVLLVVTLALMALSATALANGNRPKDPWGGDGTTSTSIHLGF